MGIIETKDLTKVYLQGQTKIYGANRINISIQKGEFVALTGKSGSGKTTILNLIGGIDKPTEGRVYIGGTDIYNATPMQLAETRRRKLGFIFQSFNLIPVLSAKENIIMPTLLDAKEYDKAYFTELVKTLGVHDRLAHLPSELSGGQKQRVAIARALINKPEVLLADEPTGNLDKKSADEIMALLVKLHKMGNTILLVTHDENYADMCQKKLIISDGVVISER